MNWTTLGPLLLSVGGVVGLSELLKLFVTRASRRTADKKIGVETEATISSELRQWTTQAETRARAAEARAERAEARADETEGKLQVRIDELGKQLDGMRRDVERMRLLIRDCTAGPPCPVRIALDPTIGRAR